MMRETRPEVVPDALYGMSECARHLGVDRSTVRRYAQEGFLHMRIRKVNGRRYATGKQLMKLWEDVYLYKRHMK